MSGSRRTSFSVFIGLYTTRRAPQQIRLPMKATGSATANQLSQDTELPPRPISWMAKMFCGDEMGLVMPPRLEARAMPATDHKVVAQVAFSQKIYHNLGNMEPHW